MLFLASPCFFPAGIFLSRKKEVEIELCRCVAWKEGRSKKVVTCQLKLCVNLAILSSFPPPPSRTDKKWQEVEVFLPGVRVSSTYTLSREGEEEKETGEDWRTVKTLLGFFKRSVLGRGGGGGSSYDSVCCCCCCCWLWLREKLYYAVLYWYTLLDTMRTCVTHYSRRYITTPRLRRYEVASHQISGVCVCACTYTQVGKSVGDARLREAKKIGGFLLPSENCEGKKTRQGSETKVRW